MKKHIGLLSGNTLPILTGPSINIYLLASLLSNNNDYTISLFVPWVSCPESRASYLGKHYQTKEDFYSEIKVKAMDLGYYSEKIIVDTFPAEYDTERQYIYVKENLTNTLKDCDLILGHDLQALYAQTSFHNIVLRHKTVNIVHTNNYFYLQSFRESVFGLDIHRGANSRLIRGLAHAIILYWSYKLKFISKLAAKKNYHISPVLGSKYKRLFGANKKFFLQDKGKLNKGFYFMGKLIWDKGFKEMFGLLNSSDVKKIDIYGAGRDEAAIKAYNKSFLCEFKGQAKEPWLTLNDYNCFLNCSRSEILCTTNSEALAAGLILIAPDILSNIPFKKFKNCYLYKNQSEAIDLINKVNSGEITPLKDASLKELEWGAALKENLKIIKAHLS